MATPQTEPATQASETTTELIDGTTLNYVDVIEAVISSLDSDKTAMVNQNDGGHLWKFKYGTVEVFVHLTGQSDEDTLAVWSTVLKLPAKDEAKLFRQLMEMNWTTTLEARFAILEQEVVVLSSRKMADISPSEISRAITIVASLADESDEPLQEQYGQ
jgi:hypothetical protein